MRIIVWGINYAPELTGIAVYNTGLCEYLRKEGHEVEMVSTFPYYPAWKKIPGDQGVWSRREELDGVTVHRCWHYVPERPRVWQRMLHEASFVLTSWWHVLRLKRADIYIVVSPPLLLGLAARMAVWLKRSRYWFHVQDLQPDAALRLGMVKSGRFIQFLLWCEQVAYRGAVRVSAISPGLEETLRRKGVAPERTVYWPNWVKEKDGTEPTREEARRMFEAPTGVRVVSYAGNLGVKQGLEILLEAAERLRERKDVVFWIGGGGAQREALEKMVRERGLASVQFLGVLPEVRHTALLCASDVCVIVQRHGTGAAFLPSKLLKILSLGRMVVTNAEPGSALHAAVEEGQFGLATASESGNDLALALERVLAEAGLREQCEQRAGDYVKQFLERVVLEKINEELEQCR